VSSAGGAPTAVVISPDGTIVSPGGSNGAAALSTMGGVSGVAGEDPEDLDDPEGGDQVEWVPPPKTMARIVHRGGLGGERVWCRGVVTGRRACVVCSSVCCRRLKL
jgi:hypothetical protein